MTIVLYDKAPPADQVTAQILRLVAKYVSDLSLLSVPESNVLHAVYRWTLPCEVDMYLQRIGQMPNAPVELLVAFESPGSDVVAGFVLYLPLPANSEACGVTYMAVDEPHRRRGVGSLLMREVISRYPHVELTCPVKKVLYYERLGFQVIDSHISQVVMNTRAESATELMGIVDAAKIMDLPQVQQIYAHLIQRWGVKEVRRAEKQLERHRDQLIRHAEQYAQKRLSPSIPNH